MIPNHTITKNDSPRGKHAKLLGNKPAKKLPNNKKKKNCTNLPGAEMYKLPISSLLWSVVWLEKMSAQ